MNRRSFLATSAAIILTPGLLMPVRKLWTPPNTLAPAIERASPGDHIFIAPGGAIWTISGHDERGGLLVENFSSSGVWLPRSIST